MAHLIRDTERAFRRALQIRLAPYGVPFGHWSFLRILWETDGLTQKELSERAGVMEPTTFAAMKAMEALGYISRQQLPTNKNDGHSPAARSGSSIRCPCPERDLFGTERRCGRLRGERPAGPDLPCGLSG